MKVSITMGEKKFSWVPIRDKVKGGRGSGGVLTCLGCGRLWTADKGAGYADVSPSAAKHKCG